jgi:hypothetical protein
MSNRKIRLYELKPIAFNQFKFFKGTYKTFGLRATLTLISPLLNTIINWKWRSYRLLFPEWFLRTQHCQLVKDNSHVE